MASDEEKWIAPNGKVHFRRRRFWVGTAYEQRAEEDEVILLCGRRVVIGVVRGVPVTCGTCLKAAHTGAQHS